MKPVVAAVLALTAALAVLAIIWVAPVVGLKNSECNQYPYAANCR